MYLTSINILVAASLSTAVQVLPRGHHAAIVPPAMAELCEVTVNDTNRLDALTYHRLRIPTNPAQKKLISSGPDTSVLKRTLLSPRQSCSAGFGLCYGRLVL